MRHLVVALLGLILLPSCQTDLLVSDISRVPVEKEVRVDGVPFRVRQTYTVRVYRWDQSDAKDAPNGSWNGTFKQAFVTHRALPNPDRVFVLGFKAAAFAGHEFNVTYAPDNTFVSAGLKGTPSGDGFAELATQASTVAGKLTSLEHTIASKEKALLEGRAELDTARSTAFDRVQALRDRTAELRNLLTGWTPENTGIEKQARQLMAEINSRAVGLGQEPPWPLSASVPIQHVIAALGLK